VVNLDLIEFKKDHAHLMVNALMNDPMVQLDEKYHEQLNELEVPGMSFTAIKDNKIICSGGVIPVWDQVFEGWVMGSHLIWQNRISAAKIIKKGMEFLIKQNNIVRLQTAVKKDFYLGHRFAEWLGMEKEGIMKKYQNNEDYIRFARII
jgi:RimJ/RimL family protein N-acetyltransferase|tara:strand:+ start:469 stop:915 length:447 start_codon:yes stop_codon:yes gene_type:complete